MSVFFWILIGLTWVGGVISMLTEGLDLSLKDLSTKKWLKSCFSIPNIKHRFSTFRGSPDPITQPIAEQNKEFAFSMRKI